MADKTIGSLERAAVVTDDTLMAAEQGGQAMSVSGEQFRTFAENSTRQFVNGAIEAAEAAQTAMDGALDAQAQAQEAQQAADASAEKAQQYSGKPALPGGSGNWMIWNADTGEYEDSGKRYLLNYDKTYASKDEMEADAAVQPAGTVAIIASDVNVEDNAKTYIKREDGSWGFLADLSGFPGVGIESWEKTEGTGDPGTTDTYTVTLTDGREETYTVYNGADGEGKVSSVNKKTGDVVLTAEDVDAYTKIEVDEKIKTAISRKWTITVDTEDWQSTTDSFSEITAIYKAEKICLGMGEDSDITDITYMGGDLADASSWGYLRPGQDTITFFSETKPGKGFTIEITATVYGDITEYIYTDPNAFNPFFGGVPYGREINDSWEVQSERYKQGDFSGLRIGDYKTVQLNNGETVIAEVAGIDTYYPTVGHHVDFISRDALETPIKWNNTPSNNSMDSSTRNPWLVSNVYKGLNENIVMLLPEDLLPYIIEKSAQIEEKYSEAGNAQTSNGWSRKDIGKLWLPTEVEVYGCAHWSQQGFGTAGAGCNQQYPIFVGGNRHKMKHKGIDGQLCTWWELSTRTNSNVYVCYVNSNGSADGSSPVIDTICVPLCFRIG